MQCVSARVPGEKQPGGVRRHLAAPLDLVAVNRAGVVRRRVGTHLVERPAEVHGRRPRGAEHGVGCRQILAERGRERDPVGGGDPDRRSAAHDHRPDRAGHLGRVPAGDVDLLAGKPALVEEDDACRPRSGGFAQAGATVTAVAPTDQVPSSHEARYFACSSVSVSIETPIVASLRRAISSSISRGTG